MAYGLYLTFLKLSVNFGYLLLLTFGILFINVAICFPPLHKWKQSIKKLIKLPSTYLALLILGSGITFIYFPMRYWFLPL